MRYLGWILFVWGILLYLTFTILILKNDDITGVFEYGTTSILTIGVGSYLIKNFTPEKK